MFEARQVALLQVGGRYAVHVLLALHDVPCTMMCRVLYLYRYLCLMSHVPCVVPVPLALPDEQCAVMHHVLLALPA